MANIFNPSQCVGFVAMILGIISFQFNDRKKLLIMQALMGLLWTVSFFLLGKNGYTGAAMNLIGTARSFIYANKDKKWASHPIIPYIFSALFIVSGIWTYAKWTSILPIIAMVLLSFVFWSDNTGKVRKLNLPCNVLWLTYDALCLSWTGVITELFMMTSIIVAMVRFDRKKKEEQKHNQQNDVIQETDI